MPHEVFRKGIREGKKLSKDKWWIRWLNRLSTGLSTGVVNGKKVNSQELKLPSVRFKGDEKQFELDRIKIDLKLSELR